MLLATLCYLKHQGHTLMIHRNKKPGDIHSGKWNGLGGKFEPGETPEECVIREVLEESGLLITEPRYHGLIMFPRFKGEDWYVFVFSATHFTGEQIPSPEGDLAWVPDCELEALPLWPSDHIFLPWMAQDRFFSAKFLYNGDDLISSEVVFHYPGL